MLPAPHKISQLSEEYCREIEKRTNGGVKITMFHGGTLSPATQAYDGVVNGLSDIAMGVFSYHMGRFRFLSSPWITSRRIRSKFEPAACRG
jgi:TRAP-type transport system periplasmic protein